jgi:hypothetical protein
MSDVFTGEFVSNGIWIGPDSLKSYCPKEGTRMRLRKITISNTPPGFKPVYYKLEFTSNENQTMTAPILKKAIYFNDGLERLAATAIEIPDDQLLNEDIVVIRHPTTREFIGLEHRLSFSSGAVGSWPCRPL